MKKMKIYAAAALLFVTLLTGCKNDNTYDNTGQGDDMSRQTERTDAGTDRNNNNNAGNPSNADDANMNTGADTTGSGGRSNYKKP